MSIETSGFCIDEHTLAHRYEHTRGGETDRQTETERGRRKNAEMKSPSKKLCDSLIAAAFDLNSEFSFMHAGRELMV